MNSKKKSRSIYPGWILSVLGVLCLLNLLLFFCYYHHYQSKIDILAQMLQSQELSGAEGRNLDLITELLNGKDGENDQGREVLKEYGFLQLGRNRYQMQFYKECAATVGVSVLLFCLFLIFVRQQKNQEQDGQERLLMQMEQCLLQLREGNSGLVALQENLNQGRQREEVRAAAHRVNHQLEALQEQLMMVREQARREREETKELVTDISHQLKTPVAALDTCLDILMQPSLNETERMEFTGRCRNELDGLEKLLHSLLQISRMEAGMIQIRLKNLPVLNIIMAAVNRIFPKASEKEIEIVVDYKKGIENLCVMLDEKWFCEALINILDNSVKYSPKESQIKLSLHKRSSFLRMEIQDEGIGIAKSDYHKVFQRFYRGADSRVREESGSGVGLYLVREIVQKHHGTVSVSSAYGKSKEKYPGTVFVIQIPL